MVDLRLSQENRTSGFWQIKNKSKTDRWDKEATQELSGTPTVEVGCVNEGWFDLAGNGKRTAREPQSHPNCDSVES